MFLENRLLGSIPKLKVKIDYPIVKRRPCVWVSQETLDAFEKGDVVTPSSVVSNVGLIPSMGIPVMINLLRYGEILFDNPTSDMIKAIKMAKQDLAEKKRRRVFLDELSRKWDKR
jgi:hypothetical protein